MKQFIDKELVSKQKYLHVEKVQYWRIHISQVHFQHLKHIFSKPKSADAENPMSEYRWGSRAHAEVKKSEILKWVSKVYKCKPESFRDQFEEVCFFIHHREIPRYSRFLKRVSPFHFISFKAKQEDPNADFDDDAERMEAD